jgi:N-glycosylase/DNA lyase
MVSLVGTTNQFLNGEIAREAMTASKTFPVRDYDLAGTLCSGQAFRWQRQDESWVGVVGTHWVRLRSHNDVITAETAEPISDWAWLTDYLQTDLDLQQVLRTFPDDDPMRAATTACRGLRLLRQDPWECLASFILSSTKQIVQIQQIIALLCERYGERLASKAPNAAPVYEFPSAARIAEAGEAELRACKMGFRAPYLLKSARIIAEGALDLESLRELSVEAARDDLMKLPGVGRKIADCVLLFAYGFQSAFPLDVWVLKALRQLYFPRRRVSMGRLHQFAAEYFRPSAGYAQQYLFHYTRTKLRANNSPVRV